ncbi:peptidase S8/S53 domain-containing protein [Bisporella sp. PMI_857]|nr:peptidase S8/S53 domain-containing protein [Bisporella sp. PMI_857]
MLLLPPLLLAGLLTVVSSYQIPDVDLGKPEDFGTIKEPKLGGFIVELRDGAELTRRSSAHQMFHKRAALNLNYKVRTEFKAPAIFYGVSIQLDQNKTLTEVTAILEQIPEVVAVYPNLKVLKPILPSQKNNNFSEALAQSVPKLPNIKGKADVANALKLAEVDRLHALGIKGKGIKIGIIDSGVDYRHPSLGGGFGPGFKVAGGYAFVEDNWLGNAPVESPDPLATCYNGGHGTHTAGIIGMQDPKNVGFGLTGVAPEASLYAYRVFGCLTDATYTDIIISAMIKAAEDKVDIISMSLGAIAPFEGNSPFATVVKAITDQGTAIIAANGNDGYLGLYFASTPGNAKATISVGSIQNTKFPILYPVEDSKGATFQYASVWPLDYPKGLNVHYHGSACSYAAWSSTGSAVRALNASNTIVLVGTSYLCPLGTQMSAASSFGVSNLLAYSIETDPFELDIETQIPFVVTTLVTDKATGETLAKNVAADPKYLLKFNNQATVQGPKLVTGGLMSNFSTFGPTWDTLGVKPQLSAPGGKILSTWPLGPYGGYAIISGTSMATPFIAGCYALVKSKFPNLSISEITSLLQSTATPVSYAYDQKILSTAAHQGSGLVNPYKAILASSTISPSQLQIGDTDSFSNKPQKITIKNRSLLPVIYTVKHKGAGYTEYFPFPDLLQPSDWYFWAFPQYSIYGSASFSSSVFTLFPGQSQTIDVTISPPKLTDAQIHKTPVFSGFIEISSLLETYTIPYLGAPYSRQKVNAIDLSNTTLTDWEGTRHNQKQPVTYQLPGLYNDNRTWVVKFNDDIDVYNASAWEFPNIQFNLLQGMCTSSPSFPTTLPYYSPLVVSPK